MNRLLLTIIMILGIFTSFSQTNQSLRASGNVGLNSLFYSIEKGASQPKLGYGGRVDYCFFFTPNWGVGGGIGASMYTTDGYMDGTVVSIENQIDDEGHRHRKDIYMRDWRENQKIFFLEVPIILHYQYDFSLEKRRRIYLNIGAKFQLPLMANFEVINGEMEIQGYYEEWNVTFFGMPNHGFGKERHKPTFGNLDLPFNISATFGIGFSFEIAPMVDLFVGGSLDYGFMNLKSTNTDDLVYIDHNNVLQYRGLFVSSAIEKANTVSILGEIGVRIAIGKSVQKGIYSYKRRY